MHIIRDGDIPSLFCVLLALSVVKKSAYTVGNREFCRRCGSKKMSRIVR